MILGMMAWVAKRRARSTDDPVSVPVPTTPLRDDEQVSIEDDARRAPNGTSRQPSGLEITSQPGGVVVGASMSRPFAVPARPEAADRDMHC